MEYRRLQMSKGGSFLLSLPKEWVQKNRLEGGDVLKLVEVDGCSLTIKAEGTAEAEKGITVIIRDPEGMERQIRANYLAGTDIMVIDLGRRMTPAMRDQVKTAIHKLIGLEIVEEEANSITIQCLLQPTSMPIKSTLRRAYVLAASMHKESEQALANGDVELAESVSRRDDEVDRLYFLIVRQLRLALRNPSVAEKLGVGPAECLDLRMAAKYVETIADYSEAVADSVSKLSQRGVDKNIIEALYKLSAEAYSIHEEAAQALFKQDVKLAESVMMKSSKLTEGLILVNELLMSGQPSIAALLDSIAMYFYQIGSHGIDLAELVSGAKV